MTEVKRPRVVLVNRCVIRDEDKLLLVKRAASDSYAAGLWEFPGGKLDYGQDLSAGLQREVFEETGLKVEPMSPLVYADSFIIDSGKYRGLPYVVLFGVARVISGEVKLSIEHDEYAWEEQAKCLDYNMSPESEKALRFLSTTLLADVRHHS